MINFLDLKSKSFKTNSLYTFDDSNKAFCAYLYPY